MVSFEEALRLLLEKVPRLDVESCRLEEAGGRVLREKVVADRDFPAFDRVMMDGFGVRIADWQTGIREFRIMGSAPAGCPEAVLAGGPGACLEVMTGAPCPVGVDGIIPVEEVIGRTFQSVTFREDAEPVAGRFLHRRGSDAAAGTVLLESGRKLGAREIGVAASCGASVLAVSKIPRLAVVATGDELVAVGEFPAAHQIRQSNGHSMATALGRAGYPPATSTVMRDEISTAMPEMSRLLESHEWLVITGAVSMGGRDFVPQVLEDLGCVKIFHGIAQRPGKPAGCWIAPAGQVIVALPGNPVSALTGLHALVIPALKVASGELPPIGRRVAVDVGLKFPRMTRHLPVCIDAGGRVTSAPSGNSGDFIGLLASDGFVTLPPADAEDGSACGHLFTPWL